MARHDAFFFHPFVLLRPARPGGRSPAVLRRPPGCGAGQASSATEKVVCTDAPRAQWISQAQARERFRAQDYVLVKYKVSSGNCHEFYAVDAQGTVVESYLHPITGETVRSTRMPPLPSAPAKH